MLSALPCCRLLSRAARSTSGVEPALARQGGDAGPAPTTARLMMHTLPFQARIYVVSVTIGSIVFLLAGLVPSVPSPHDFADAVVFIILNSIAEMKPVQVAEHWYVSVSPVFQSAAYILFRPWMASVIAAVCSIVADAAGRRPLFKAAFNAAQYMICVGTAGLIYRSAALGYPRDDLVRDMPVFVLATLAYYFLNVGFICFAFALAESRPPVQAILSQMGQYLFQYLSLASLGMLVAFVYSREALGLSLLLLPTAIVYYGLKDYSDLQTQTRLTVEALADSIDRRDDFTYDHSLRVAEYSAATAREMRLPEKVVEQIHLAARIHDLGKVGLSNRVLFKEGALHEDEWERVREHPQIGGQITGKLKIYRRSTAFVRHHHENYDGSGYPDGLVGEDIPIGARIIRVADAFDAMTNDRPYRKAEPVAVAVSELLKGKGTQFDPEVVDAFLRVLRGSGS